MTSKKAGAALLVLLIIAVVIAAGAGYGMNVYDLVAEMDTNSTSETVVRAVGVFIPFIGAVAGYF